MSDAAAKTHPRVHKYGLHGAIDHAGQEPHDHDSVNVLVIETFGRVPSAGTPVVKNERVSGYMFIAPGVRPFPVAGGFGIGKSGEDLRRGPQRSI